MTDMSATPSLGRVRAEIDAIDDAIHDLIMKRAELLAAVEASKGPGGQVCHPGREAAILRRLVARHSGRFPPSAIVRIWREIIASFVHLQQRFAVAVQVGDGQAAWDAAHDHFGSATQMIPVTSAVAALRSVSEGTATFAVLPWPREDQDDGWWRYLIIEDRDAPRVFARLPFIDPTGPGGGDHFMALGPVHSEPTGDDSALLGIELVQEMSRGRLKDMLSAAGLEATMFRSLFDQSQPALSTHLVQIAGHVAPDDARLVRLRDGAPDALGRVVVLGTYANQLMLQVDG